MDKISSSLTNYFLKNGIIKEADYEIYKYGLQIEMEILICIITCYIVAIWMDMFGKCTMLLLILMSLRSFVGGLHFNSFKFCYACSCISIVLILISVQNFEVTKSLSLIVSIFEIILIYILEPVENINRPVNVKEKMMFSDRIRVILCAIFILIIICYFFNLNSYLLTITFTLGMILISMVLGNVKNRIEKNKG